MKILRCKALTHLVFVWVVGITLALVNQASAEAYQVYYLSVGNSEYRDESYKLRPANESSRHVARYLRWAGAVDGITLVSERGHYVMKDDVIGALKKIISKAKMAKEPLVVYYFMGHGKSSRPLENHVSLVGDLKKSDSDKGVLSPRATIETREIARSLEAAGLPYILILDNCYEGVLAKGALQALAVAEGKAAVKLGVAIERMPLSLEAQKSMLGIVLYAAKPGHFVLTVQHPGDDKDQTNRPKRTIGPLGRRLLLLLDKEIKSEKGLSIGRFLEQMNDPTFDPTSVTGYHTIWSPDSGLSDVTPSSPAVYGMNQRLSGMLILPGPRAGLPEDLGPIESGSGDGDSR